MRFQESFDLDIIVIHLSQKSSSWSTKEAFVKYFVWMNVKGLHLQISPYILRTVKGELVEFN